MRWLAGHDADRQKLVRKKRSTGRCVGDRDLILGCRFDQDWVDFFLGVQLFSN